MNKLLKLVFATVLAATAVVGFTACNDAPSGTVSCEHDWVVTQTVEGTCTLEGKIDYKCSKCEQTKSEKTGLGDHIGSVVFDGTHHWVEYTCEHEVAIEKAEHQFEEGVCECGFYSIDKIIKNYNAMPVLEDGVNFSVLFKHFNGASLETVVTMDFKDEAAKVNILEEEKVVMVRDGDFMYVTNVTNNGNPWLKWDIDLAFGGKNPAFINFIVHSGLEVEEIMSLKGVAFTYVEEGEWESEEIADGEGKIVVSTADGLVTSIEFISLYLDGQVVQEVSFSYGTANVGEIPEINEDNVIEGGTSDGPSNPETPDEYTFDDVLDNYNQLKLFENGQDFSVTITMHDYDGRGTVYFYVKDKVLRGIKPDGESMYMILEGDTIYALQGSWSKADKDEFFSETFAGTNHIDNFISFLVFGGGYEIIYDTHYVETGDNEWTGEIADKDLKIVVTAKDGKVIKVEQYLISTGYNIQTISFSYGDADLGNVPTPDYENAKDMFNPSAPRYTLEEIIEKVENLYAFNGNINLSVTQATYEDIEATVHIKDNVIYMPPMYKRIDANSSYFNCGQWYIYDGGYVYHGEKNPSKSFDESYTEQEVLDYYETLPYAWKRYTLEEYATRVGASDPQKIHFMQAANNGMSMKDFLAYDVIDYEYVDLPDMNVWRGSGEILGTNMDIVVSADSEGRIEYIRWTRDGEFMMAMAFGYGEAQIPKLPDYKAGATIYDVVENMNAISAFDKVNNLKVVDYDYINGEWVRLEERWGKGNVIYSPAYIDDDGEGIVYETWIIFEDGKVYFGNNSQSFNEACPSLYEYVRTHGHQAALELLRSCEVSWRVMNEQEFINAWELDFDSVNDLPFFDGTIWKSAERALLMHEGAKFYEDEKGVWKSFSLVGSTYVTAKVENGYITEIIYEDYMHRPISKYVYEYGTTILPQIPDYKN